MHTCTYLNYEFYLFCILIEMLTGRDVEDANEFERYHHNFNMYKQKQIFCKIHLYLLITGNISFYKIANYVLRI